jgi:branched-chain amino acid transport system substrate-binding protein
MTKTSGFSAAVSFTAATTIALSCLLAAHDAKAQARIVNVVQIVPQSGPLANVGKEIYAISKATLDDFNSEQPKLKVVLNAFDDGNVADTSTAMAQAAPLGTSAYLSCFGTVGCLAQQKVANEKHIPLIGAIAGAAPLRGKASGFSFVARASALDEVRTLLKFCEASQMLQISVLIQDDGFGRGYAAELEKLEAQYPSIKMTRVLFRPQAPDYKALSTNLHTTKPQALILLANAMHSTNLLAAWKEQSALPFVLNLAGQANALFSSKLKGYVGAAAFVTVAPSPWEVKSAAQRDYQRISKAASLPLSYIGFEAYLNARLLTKSLQASNAKNAMDLFNFLESTGKQDLGGYVVTYGDSRAGSSFTDLALLRSDGSYMH